jgi:hypothetical protein
MKNSLLILLLICLIGCSKSKEERLRDEAAAELVEELIEKKVQEKKEAEAKAKRDELRPHYLEQLIVLDVLREEKKISNKDHWANSRTLDNWIFGRQDEKPNYGDFNSLDLDKYISNSSIQSLLKSLKKTKKAGEL